MSHKESETGFPFTLTVAVHHQLNETAYTHIMISSGFVNTLRHIITAREFACVARRRRTAGGGSQRKPWTVRALTAVVVEHGRIKSIIVPIINIRIIQCGFSNAAYMHRHTSNAKMRRDKLHSGGMWRRCRRCRCGGDAFAESTPTLRDAHCGRRRTASLVEALLKILSFDR